MKKFDFIIQSAAFITGIGILLISLFSSGSIGFITLLQLFIGAWQVLSFLFSLLFFLRNYTTTIVNMFRNYAIGLLVYGAPFLLRNYIHISNELNLCYLFGPPWILAFYYYYICYLKLKPENRISHSFLDIY